MLLLKIDPYFETITELEAYDSITFLTGQLCSRFIGFMALQPNGDCAIGNPEALSQLDYPPAWKFIDTDEIFFGISLWTNVSENGQMRTPLLTRQELLQKIEFLGFITPSIRIEYEALELIDPDEYDPNEEDSDQD